MRRYALEYTQVLSTVPGWMDRLSAELLDLSGVTQRRLGVRGDLLEIGVFHGRSAILLGYFVDRDDERLWLCNPFGATPEHPACQRLRHADRPSGGQDVPGNKYLLGASDVLPSRDFREHFSTLELEDFLTCW